MADNSLISFKSIVNFTNDLGNIFSSKQHSLRLYCHLLNRTTFAHEKAISKHILAFRKFCMQNRDAIMSQDETKFVDDRSDENKRSGKTSSSSKCVRIHYSPNVFINIDAIFKLADDDTKKVIWKHLLVISACVDPASKAKQILQSSKGKESELLTNIISKVEQHVDTDASNPLAAISSIMSSGVLTDLIGSMNSGLSDGSLDLTKLLGSVQTMVSGLSSGSEKNDMPDISKMMASMISTIKTTEDSDSSAAPPDFAKLLSPMIENLQNATKNPDDTSTPDIAKMMGPLLEGLTNANNTDGATPDITKLLGPLLQGLSNTNSGNANSPDLSKLLGPLLSGLTNTSDSSSGPNLLNLVSGLSSMNDKSIEEQIDDEVAKMKQKNVVEILD